MKFGKRDKSIVDALFLLALFGVFLISALFIVLFGAKIYKNTVKSSDDSFLERTCYTYITEKLRQNDNSDGIEILSSDSGSIIRLIRTANEKQYATYLYCDEGYLKEYTTSADKDLVNEAGTKIIALNKLKAVECSENLYYFTLSSDESSTSFYASISSDIGGEGDDK